MKIINGKKSLATLLVAVLFATTMTLPAFAEDNNFGNADLGKESLDALYYSPEYQAFLQEWIEQQAAYPSLHIGGKKTLAVTNIQQSNTSGCGPACIYQIGNYLGFTNMGSLTALTNSMTDNNSHGTDLASQLIPFLNDRLSSNKYVLLNLSNNGFLTHLVSSIDKNRPVICHVKPEKLKNNPFVGSGHYVVAIGYNWYEQGSSGYSEVTYNDPHHNDTVFGTYTCSVDEMTLAIRSRYGYFAAA